jgi:hypothetical protein
MFSNSVKRGVATFGVVAGLLAAAVPAGAASTSQAQANNALSVAGASASQQGIIMRDGGVCDPIRHMGC